MLLHNRTIIFNYLLHHTKIIHFIGISLILNTFHLTLKTWLSTYAILTPNSYTSDITTIHNYSSLRSNGDYWKEVLKEEYLFTQLPLVVRSNGLIVPISELLLDYRLLCEVSDLIAIIVDCLMMSLPWT